MKKNTRGMNGYSLALLAGLAAVTALSAVLSALGVEPFELDDSQLLTLFSSMAQTISGMFGLTLTAYLFFADRFREAAREDDTLYDAALSIRRRSFRVLTLLAVICGTVILLSVAGTLALHRRRGVFSFLVNESVLLFLGGVAVLLIFGIRLMDPGKIEKELASMKRQAEQRYCAGTGCAGDLADFLRTYNLLERLLLDFAAACGAGEPASGGAYRPKIVLAVRALQLNRVLSDALAAEIGEIRQLRNGLVHGVDLRVSQEVCGRVREIYAALERAYEAFINTEGRQGSPQWSEAAARLDELSALRS